MKKVRMSATNGINILDEWWIQVQVQVQVQVKCWNTKMPL